MFNSSQFWKTFIWIILILIGVYIAVDLLILKKLPNRSKKQNTLINILLGSWLLILMIVLIDTLTPYLFFQTVVDKILLTCVLALATTGIVLIFKTSITTNFAQGMMATFGAFFAAKVILYLQASYQWSNFTVVLLSMLLGAAVSFILGFVIDVFIIRKAKYVTSVGKQMITMGLVLVLAGIMPVIFGMIPLVIPRLSYDIVPFTFLGTSLTISKHAFYALIITIVVLTLLFSALRFTKWGLGVRATASNEVVAGMMGVNTRLITAMSWAIAGAVGGIGAVLLAPNGGEVTVGLMTSMQVNGFMASILGGFSSFMGPIIGTVLISMLSGLLSYFGFLWQNAIVYVIILLLVLVKPLGLFGKKIAKKV
jgi:branched-chain amino acid transport system permease protein